MTTPKLDRIDINILSALQARGNISNVELGDAVGLTPSPCLQRVKRLEEAGYIESYGSRHPGRGPAGVIRELKATELFHGQASNTE